MKRLALISVLLAGILTLAGILHYANRKAAPPDVDAGINEEKAYEHEEQDGIRERVEQEFLMMRDPRLNYIPTERLGKYHEVVQRLRADRPKVAAGNGTGGQGTPTILGSGGLSWVERGPGNIGGRCRAVLVDASDVTGNTVLVGSVSGGLWRTTNFTNVSSTWTQVSSVQANLAITCLAQDPLNPSVLYAGTGEGFSNFDAVRGMGIYKSTDGGLTWTLLPFTTTGGTGQYNFSYVQKIQVYANGDVYAATGSTTACYAGGIFRSSDGGNTWTVVFGGTNGDCQLAYTYYGYDIAFSAAGDIYTTLTVPDLSTAPLFFPIGKVYKSTAGPTVGNAGTWTDITPAIAPGVIWSRISLACSRGNNNRVFAFISGGFNGVSLRRTDDGGASWTNIDSNTPWCDGGGLDGTDFTRGQSIYDLTIAVDPSNDDIVYAGGVDVMKRVNGGAAWFQLTEWAYPNCSNLPFVHADIHNLLFPSTSSSNFIIACDGGIYYTSDGGSSFQPKIEGLNVTQYYAGALHPAAGSDYMLAGAQDNGSHIFKNPGINDVSSAYGGDGGYCFIDQLDPTFQVVSYTFAKYFISRDGGANFNIASVSAGGQFINPTDYDNAGKRLYCSSALQYLKRIDSIANGRPTATDILLTSNSSMFVSAVKVDPNTADNVWVAGSASDASPPELYLVKGASTGSPVVTQVGQSTLGLAAGSYLSSIDVEKGNSSHLVVAVSNYGVSSVWESTDGGANWTSLDNNGVNLPDMPVWWALIVPSAANVNTGGPDGGILLATEMGIWSASSSNGANTVWTENSAVMGNVSTRMLSYRPADRTVMATTHGRGVFTASLSGAALPLNFLSFTGAVGATGNDLSWSVANEYNNKGFTVERSYAYSTGFLDIGFVPAALSGFRETGSYSFTDRQADAGKSVVSYRLRQTDLDGRSMYSNIVTLRREASTAMVQYMAAAGNSLYIKMGGATGGSMRLQVFDAGGRLVMGSVIAGQSQSIDIGRLAAGVYILKLTGDDGRQFSREFRK